MMWKLCVFFLFKQKTAYEMRISDWSSDVCSSDLLLQRRVDQKGGGDQPLRARRLQPLGLAVEDARIGVEARQIGFGVGGTPNGVVAAQEARHVEIGADILDHDIGRIAPAADRDIALREGEAVERGGLGGGGA